MAGHRIARAKACASVVFPAPGRPVTTISNGSGVAVVWLNGQNPFPAPAYYHSCTVSPSTSRLAHWPRLLGPVHFHVAQGCGPEEVQRCSDRTVRRGAI